MLKNFTTTNCSMNPDQMFNPNSYLSLSEFFDGSSHQDQNLTFPSDEVVSVVRGEVKPNSSASSAEKTIEDDESSKRYVKGKGRQQRQPRFAFMTKSEVDHLEDGYRWRKYGQKAVKNSAYPRSYYKCTTQKCVVKKRVERSFEDPSIVVTTYEGQHNHHIPVARTYAPSPSSFCQELGLDQTRASRDVYGYDVINNEYNMGLGRQQLNQFPDYGLLQDTIPPVFPMQELSDYPANFNRY